MIRRDVGHDCNSGARTWLMMLGSTTVENACAVSHRTSYTSLLASKPVNDGSTVSRLVDGYVHDSHYGLLPHKDMINTELKCVG